MKIHKSLSLALLVAAGSLLDARAAQFRTNINPALLYYMGFMTAPDMPQTDHHYLSASDWRGQKLPTRFGDLVSGYNHEFEFMAQAAQSTVPCDFGIDWSRGPETLLPHLSRIKAAAVAARWRAMWDLQHGRPDDARTDLLAALTLGRNGARDGCLISGLVQIAVDNIICSTVAENFFQLPPTTLSELVAGFDAAPARATVAASIQMEKSSCRDWIVNRIIEAQKANPGNDGPALDVGRRTFEYTSEGENADTNTVWPRILAAAGGTSDGLLRLFQELDPYYSRLTEVLKLPRPQYEEQMKLLSAEIHNSKNPVMTETLPAYEKCRPKEFAVIAVEAMMRAAVQYKLHGAAGLQSVPDPFGQGPFAMERFFYEGVDRGFQLKSAYDGRGFPEVMIFVEKDGVPFYITGKNAGKAIQP